MTNEASLHQVETIKHMGSAGSDESLALDYTAFEDMPAVPVPAALLSDEDTAAIDLGNPALDDLDIGELLNLAFTNLHLEEGLSAERPEDDSHFDHIEDPAIGVLNEEHGSDPELGTLLPNRVPLPELTATPGTDERDPEADKLVDGGAGQTSEQIIAAPEPPSASETHDPDLDFDEEFRPASEVLGASTDSEQPGPPLENERDGAVDTDGPAGTPYDQSNQKIKSAFSMARETNGSDLMDGLANAQSSGPNANYPESQIRVGLIQGLSMLGGAGLAGLAKMVQSGGSTINNRLRQRQYGKLSGELDQITNNMDSLMVKLNANGLSAGLDGLKGPQRNEFMNEFLEIPANKGMFNELITSLGSLATKSTEAAVVGAAAGLSPDQLDSEITRRISDVQQKHKSLLESMTDHNGVSLSDRLSNIAAQLASAIDKLFQRASQAMGFGPRPGM